MFHKLRLYREQLALMERLYAERVTDLKEAHAREAAALKLTIEALAEQVDYLRAVGGRPQLSAPRLAMHPMAPADVLGEEPYRMEPAQFESEEEADLRSLKEAGLLDAEDLQAALAQLGFDYQT